MAGVAEVLASAVVKAVAGKLAAAVGEQVSLWRNHERDLNDMKGDLDLAVAVLRAAEKRSFMDPAVCRWLQQLKAVAYEISDSLDDGQFGDDHSGYSCLAKLKSANKIKELKKKLKAVVERRQIFGFDLQDHSAKEEAITNNVVIERQTIADVDRGSMIVGRSQEKEEIIGLLHKDESTTIVPIVGLGGMGKTTLAKLIFNDKKMADFNGRKVWVYVSQKFDLVSIGKTVISQLGGAIGNYDDLQSVSNCLGDVIKDGKFLIVLDDLWEQDEDQLGKLRSMLQCGKNQITMKIIVTTRTEEVARRMHALAPFTLKPLSNDSCWTVFKQSAFLSTEFYTTEEDELEVIGRHIAMKCKGLPLAAHTVGSMLHGRPIEFWRAIRDSDTWNESGGKVLPSLRLSYDHMPYHLKQCFAYCAIFPKGFIIAKDKLIQQWIALGLVQPSLKKLSHNAQAEQYVRELSEMSFFQNSLSDSSSSSMSYKDNMILNPHFFGCILPTPLTQPYSGLHMKNMGKVPFWSLSFRVKSILGSELFL